MTQIKNKAELYSSDLIDQFINEISPEEYERTKNKMLLAARIDDAIRAKGWKNIDLANALNKKPSVITKWLSGTHNFTADTLWDIEKALNIKLIYLSDDDAIVVQKFYFTATTTVERKTKGYNVFHDFDNLIPLMEGKMEYGQTK